MKLKKYSVSLKVNETVKPIPFSQAVDEYMAAQQMRLSKHTLLDYGLTYRRAREYFGGEKLIAQIEARDVRYFLADAIPGSNKNKLNARIGLGALWTWCEKEGYIEDHVIHRVEKPKIVQTVINPFSKEEVIRLLEAMARQGVRDRAIILILLDTGLRASELCGLRISDLRGEYVKVLGKGAKEREVPVSASGLKAMLDYFQRPKPKPSKFIFLSERGNPMTPDSLKLMNIRLGDRAGVEDVHPHRFRHTFAVNYLLNGGDPYTLQRILGHSTLDMVKRYLSFVKEDLVRVHRRASPIENWGLTSR